jgi:hypothetical protein
MIKIKLIRFLKALNRLIANNVTNVVLLPVAIIILILKKSLTLSDKIDSLLKKLI